MLKDVLDGVLEYAKFPKVQLERAIGPMLHRFMAPLVSALLGGAEVQMVAAEFPLEIDGRGNLQSFNIDWLLYVPSEQRLVLVELKTHSGGYRQAQSDQYIDVQDKILQGNFAEKMQRFVRDVARASHSDKYEHVLAQVERLKNLPMLRSTLIYLVPEQGAGRPMEFGSDVRGTDKDQMWVNFSTLADLPVPVSYQPAWHVLGDTLRQIDQKSRVSERQEFAAYYQARADFQSMLEKAEQYPERILIGFIGGLKALKSTELAILKARIFKFDFLSNGHDGDVLSLQPSRKQYRNWISGKEFLATVQSKEQPPSIDIAAELQERLTNLLTEYAKELPESVMTDGVSLKVHLTLGAPEGVRCTVERFDAPDFEADDQRDAELYSN